MSQLLVALGLSHTVCEVDNGTRRWPAPPAPPPKSPARRPPATKGEPALPKSHGVDGNGTGKTSPPNADASPSQAIAVLVSLSIPLKKGNRYVQIDSVKIEGELKASPLSAPGAVTQTNQVGVPLGKGPVAPGKKIEIDLAKVKALLTGQLKAETEGAGWSVSPNLEIDASTAGINAALSVKVVNAWYEASAKFIAVAKEKGKDLQLAEFEVSPFAATVSLPAIDLGGEKFAVSGKITLSLLLTPMWKAIAADVGQSVGRRVGTTVVEILSAEAFIVSGFVAIAAAQVFVFVKAAGEITDIKACAKAAKDGWLSFRSGYGSVYGISWNDGGAAQLRKSGAACANQFLQARLKAVRARVQQERGQVPPGFNEEFIATYKVSVAKDSNHLDKIVHRNFQRAILEGFLKAYENEHRDDYQFEPNYRALKALVLGEA